MRNENCITLNGARTVNAVPGNLNTRLNSVLVPLNIADYNTVNILVLD